MSIRNSDSATTTANENIFLTFDSLSKSGFSTDGSFYFEAHGQVADYFLSVYNILSSIWSIVAAMIMVHFGRQIYKDKIIRLVTEGPSSNFQVEMLANLHNSLFNNPASIALFADNISLSSILAIIVLALSTAVNIYSSAIPLAISRTYDLFDASQMQRKVSIVNLTGTSFTNGSPFNAKGQKSGYFFPFYYYSQLPNRGLFYGLALDNGSIPLVRLPFGGIGQDFDSKVKKTPVMVSNIPVAVINISDYSFKIVPQTATSPERDYYDKWSVTAIEDGSNFTYSNNNMYYSCLISTPFPWTSCNVPEKFEFTIVQKTPLLSGTYDYGSSIFHIPGAPIDGYYPNGTPLNGSLETAYVFQATINIKKSRLFGRLNATSNSWILLQQYMGETLYSDYSDVEEILFKKISIAVVRLLEKQFTSQSAKERAKYTWNQLRELIALDHLDKENSGYDKHNYARELEQRITAVVNQWIFLNTLQTDDDSKLNDNNSLTINFVVGRISSRITFSMAAIVGVVLMIIWIALAILIVLLLFCIRERRKLRISNTVNQFEVQAMEELCSAPQGMAILLKRLKIETDEKVKSKHSKHILENISDLDDC